VSADISQPDAASRIIDHCLDLDIGLIVFNAGADTNNAAFLDGNIEDWLNLIRLNTITPLMCCHHFATLMKQRGRGGILMVGSGACHSGGPNMAAYAGTKAFNLRFAEGLWAELAPYGVDVLFFALGRTDTPMLRRFLADQGLPLPDGLAKPHDVVIEALAKLPFGPGADYGVDDSDAGLAGISAWQRRERVKMIAASTQSIFKKT